MRLGRYDGALKDWDRAIEMDDGHHQLELRIKRASNLLNVKDPVRASADAAAIAESSSSTAGDLYNAACVYSLCVQLSRDDATRADVWGARAVVLIRQAVARGYKDIARIKTHTDLESLRSREDFQQLIKEMEAGPDK